MKRWPELLAFTALAGVLGLAVAMQPEAPAAKPATNDTIEGFMVRGAHVFDGERNLGITNVVVRDGRIVEVAADAQVPDGMPVIDGSGKTLLPGLIDAHVHAWGDAQRDMLRFGVTTGLDMHGDAGRLASLRKQRESLDATTQADLWAAGYAITAPGGHGTQYGFPVPTVDAGTDIDAFIGERVGEGADFIKLIIEDLSAYRTQRRLPTLAAPQVRAVVHAAHARKRLAMAHVAKLGDARLAVDAGADGLVHVFTDVVADDAFVASMREHQAFVIPTLSVVASMGGMGTGKALADDARIKPFLTAEQAGTLARDFGAQSVHLQRAIDSVGKLHAAGIDVLAGSDAPNPGTAHGASLHHELKLLVDAGLTPVQALAAATSVPARRFGLADRGRIASGMRADLVLVDGNPLADITTTRAISSVWKNGHRVQRDVAAVAGATVESLSAETLVSDFDGTAISANFGSWQATTDTIAGGASVVEHALVPDGAGGSAGALRVAGEVKAGFAFPWSGVIFFPATQPTQPVDLSSRKALVLQVRGDGRRYNAMLFSGQSMQGMPSTLEFVAGETWTEVRLPLADFPGADLAQVRGIAFTAGQPLGAFEFRIDSVELR